MTLEELSHFDGRNGKAAYVAFQGAVYDVSKSPLWQGGAHEGLHRAGTDLTAALAEAPHGKEVFAAFPIVGTLEDPSAMHTDSTHARTRKQRLHDWYRRYHPHPMLVHFPIALHLFAAAADLWFLARPSAEAASMVFYTFFAATVMGGAAMIPGVLSWWVNYAFVMARPFVVKLVVSVLMIVLGIAAIAIYLENPMLVFSDGLETFIYHGIVLITGAGVIVLGYYGGKITWGDAFATPEHDNIADPLPPECKKENNMAETIDTDTLLAAANQYPLPNAAQTSAPPVKLSSSKYLKKTKTGGRQLSLLIGGAAGLGIDTLEGVLNDAFRRSGFYVFSSKEFMSRVRGGSNTVLIRLGDAPIEAPCWEVDLFVALDAPALEHAAPRLTEETMVIADESFAKTRDGAWEVPIQHTAKTLGDKRYANTFAAGLLFGLFRLDAGALQKSVAERFGEDEGNAQAVIAGVKVGVTMDAPAHSPHPDTTGEAKALHLLDGTTASGFGFLAGGCNFVAAYPMSPSTGVLNFMAARSKTFDIAVEQSEDEIASIHMVIGAWYAGGRALTTTSGGGFALMGEGISLAGITETPAVIYLAQRPGPATGMPTRSEQGDLNLALHSGHGPFPRILLAPGSVRECIDMGYLAFELADRWQVPVIVLSDQYLADSTAMTGALDLRAYEPRRYADPSTAYYRRYEDAPGGISPRAIPGYGDGLICADGHEHDERGQITEDFRVREQMVAKRARKRAGILTESLPPEVSGEGSIAVIGWGSTRGAVAEAIARLDDPRLVQVHFAWVHPLDPKALAFLDEYACRIVVENNADGAFADQLTLHGVRVDQKILQSNGFAFFVDQLAEKLASVLKELS